MIAAALLSAGRAQRFDGRQKLLVPVQYDGRLVPLVRLSVLGLMQGGVEQILVVGGRDGTQVRDCLDGLDVAFVLNEAFASGLSSSLRVGVEEVARRWPNSEGLMIALGDQPLVGTGIVAALLERLATRVRTASEPWIVAPRFRGNAGNPVLFSRALVPELLLVTGDRGARAVVERDPSRVEYVAFDRDAPLDVDTLDDLADLTGNLRLS
jgi:molybdenum cofactor cytidylyltransferase